MEISFIVGQICTALLLIAFYIVINTAFPRKRGRRR